MFLEFIGHTIQPSQLCFSYFPSPIFSICLSPFLHAIYSSIPHNLSIWTHSVHDLYYVWLLKQILYVLGASLMSFSNETKNTSVYTWKALIWFITDGPSSFDYIKISEIEIVIEKKKCIVKIQGSMKQYKPDCLYMYLFFPNL